MIGLEDINKVEIPFSKIEEVYSHLRYAGTKRIEGVALLSGKREGETESHQPGSRRCEW